MQFSVNSEFTFKNQFNYIKFVLWYQINLKFFYVCKLLVYKIFHMHFAGKFKIHFCKTYKISRLPPVFHLYSVVLLSHHLQKLARLPCWYYWSRMWTRFISFRISSRDKLFIKPKLKLQFPKESKTLLTVLVIISFSRRNPIHNLP